MIQREKQFSFESCQHSKPSLQLNLIGFEPMPQVCLMNYRRTMCAPGCLYLLNLCAGRTLS